MPIAAGFQAILPRLLQMAKTQPARFKQIVMKSPRLQQLIGGGGPKQMHLPGMEPQSGVLGKTAGAIGGAARAAGRGAGAAGRAAGQMAGGAAGAMKDAGAMAGRAAGRGWNKAGPGGQALVGGGAGTAGAMAAFGGGQQPMPSMEEIIMNDIIQQLGLPPDTPPEVIMQILQGTDEGVPMGPNSQMYPQRGGLYHQPQLGGL